MKLLYLSLTLFYCFSIFSKDKLQYPVSEIPKNLKEGANSVVRYDNMVIDITAVDEMTITSKFVITILNSKGEKSVRLSQYYAPERRIELLEAIVYNEYGEKVKKIKENDFNDYSTASGYTVATDNRVLDYEYKSGKFPYTIEINKKTTTANTAFMPSFYFLGRYSQGVEYASITINNPNEFGIRKRDINFKDFDIKEKENTSSTIKYSAYDIEPVAYQKRAPSSFFPFVKFSLDEFTLINKPGKASNWAEMGKWQYDSVIKGRQELPQSTIDHISKLVENATTDIEKAKIIYKYVQDRTRYVSIQLGIGGWQPILAKTVDETGYGDCKALSNYTKALLDSQNIPCNYCVVYAGNKQKSFPEDFSALMGNHIILNLPQESKDDIWLECTSQMNPFGFIGGFTDDRNVLVLTPEKGIIKKTTKYTADDNVISSSIDLQLTSQNFLTGNVSQQFSGMKYRDCESIERTDNKTLKIQSRFSHLSSFKPNNIDVTTDYDTAIGDLRFDFTIDEYCQKAGTRLLFKPSVFNKVYKEKNTTRHLDFEVQRGSTYKTTYKLTLSEDLTPKTLPTPIELDSDLGTYKLSFSQQGNVITINRLFKMNEIYLKAEDYLKYLEFINTIANHDNKPLIFLKK